jgi:hypothetical protein
VSPPPQLLKSFVLDLEWSDGQKVRLAGESLIAEFTVGPKPKVVGDLQPEMVVDVVHLAVSQPRYELILKFGQHSHNSRLEVFTGDDGH